jgi:hypothetical protein
VEQILPESWGLASMEVGSGGEGSKRMNMVQIMYIHVCKCKSDTS